MITMHADDRVALRRWAVEQALHGRGDSALSPGLIEVAREIEAYVLDGLVDTVGTLSSDGCEAAPIQSQQVGLCDLLDSEVGAFPGAFEAVPEQGIGDGFRAVAVDDVGQDRVSVGCDSATVGDGAGAGRAPAPDRMP